MIPYFGMHSAKQTMRVKSVRFGYKNFVLAGSDGYPYHIIPYSGANGIGGSPGKDLTLRVVTDLVLRSGGGISNLTFDNWYTSTKLMSALTGMGIPTVCTARKDRVGKAPVLSTMEMKAKPRGHFSHAFDDGVGIHCVSWMDNSVVTLLSNCTGPYPLDNVERYSGEKKKKVSVPRPGLIKLYNNAMGGVDLLDGAVAQYRIKIRSKKWWWPHFSNALGIMVGAAWKIWKAGNPTEDQSLLFFVRSIVTSYLHKDTILVAPSYWKTKVVVLESKRLTGRSHWPGFLIKQRRCAIPECSSKVRSYCMECDVALCIDKDHFKLFHTLK